MKEQLDLVKILKDCPKGMELDCTMYDNVTLKSVSLDINNSYPICIETKHGFNTKLTKYGQNICINDAKCVIFPKGKTTWEGFVPSINLKNGDVVVDDSDAIFIYKQIHTHYEEPYADFYCGLSSQLRSFIIKTGEAQHCGKIDSIRPATEEEKRELFNAIKAKGYRWNPETKTLEKLIVPKFKVGDTIRSKNGLQIYKISNVTSEYYTIRTQGCTGLISVKDQDDWILIPNKFDPKTLKPFDKVLVRDIGCSTRWHIQFFETMYEDKKKYPFVCLGGKIHSYCIPYNDDTKHLVNKMDEAPEFYRYWEN